jgi:tetratricopeptide (TPR) repeat protein
MFRRPHFLISLVLVALLAGAGYFQVRRFQANKHLAAARTALAAHDFPGARDQLRAHLALDPNDAEAHLLAARAERGIALLDTLKPGWDSAIQTHLQEARRLGADAEAVRFELALTSALGGSPEAERYLLSRATGDGPEAISALETLVRMNLDNHQFSHARRCADRLLELDSDHPLALFWRGLIQEAQLQFDPELADYRRAVELAPDLLAARLRLAGCLVVLNRHQEAAPHYRWLLERRPTDREVLLGLATCCQTLGEFAEASTLLDRLLALDPENGPALLLRGRATYALGSAGEAETWLKKGLARSPYDAAAYYTLARCLGDRGDQAGASRAQARADELTADWKKAHEITARIARQPNDAGLRCQAGELLLRLGQESLGLNWLHSALQIDPGQSAAHRALTAYYERKGDQARAAEHRRRAEANDTIGPQAPPHPYPLSPAGERGRGEGAPDGTRSSTQEAP